MLVCYDIRERLVTILYLLLVVIFQTTGNHKDTNGLGLDTAIGWGLFLPS